MLLSTFLLHTFVSGLLLSLAIMDYLLALSMCEFHNPRRRTARRGRGKWREEKVGGEKGRGGGGRGWRRERGGQEMRWRSGRERSGRRGGGK